MSINNILNVNPSTPLIPAWGGTGVSNGTHTLTINANSTINQDVSTTANPAFNNVNTGYTTTATAAGTTTLTVASTYQQFFTGSTTQTVVLPVTSTLVLGFSFFIVNNSSGAITIQSSGGNTIVTMGAGTFGNLTCILTSGTSAASWSAEISMPSGGGGNGFTSQNDVTGSRTSGAVYQNTTGKTMFITVCCSLGTGPTGIVAYSDSTNPPTTTVVINPYSGGYSISFMVLNNNYYQVGCIGSCVITHWIEWY